MEWHTRVCDTARITRVGWTGIFVVGGLVVLVSGLAVQSRRQGKAGNGAPDGPAGD
ncbi:MAG: hypothetical protein ACRDP3_00525 [Streptomyces sp.]|uniref:hypothetical protein n=1 Tax=Streptomyces sp. TaxID=1931 RepID=UPI003D6C3895